ncbi:MAG: L-seryl-tRNA(Sec) selenium transferase, partial [Actinomycetota bacterium]
MVADDINKRLRALPSVDRVLEALAGAGAPAILGDAARRAVDRARARVQDGEQTPPFDEVVADARALVALHSRSLLRPAINATGVLIHTNLGRVPLGKEQLDAVEAIAAGYSNLEYDLTAGERGSRYSHAASLITALTGAEDAVVVNNNAAAVLVVLASLCSGREVIISRGELIEIGGEFRIPEVMAASGASLVEVGTTNRTHLADYERAITPDTAAILKVHPSNYRVVGFTASV